jgi:AsmA protein
MKSDFAQSRPHHSLELELADFQIERFIHTFREEKGAEGTASFTTQQFQLVDAAAFFVAGPLGVAITKGYGFTSLFIHTGEQTRIRELVSNWDFSDGVARARDVAFSTEKNRIALAGGIDYANSQFRNLKVAAVDIEGCALVEQTIEGDFQNPRVAPPNFLAALAGSFMDIIERGVELFTQKECDPFYTGRVAPP